MGNSESNWRSQLSFIFSLLLHAGAIALIALGPTMIENRFGNQGTQPEPVDMTIVSPPSAPKVVAVKPAPVSVKAAPVVVKAKPQVRRPPKIAKVVVPKPVVAKTVIAKPVMRKSVAAIPVVKKVAAIAPAPIKRIAEPVKPIAAAKVEPQTQAAVAPAVSPIQTSAPVKSAAPVAPSVAGTPTGSKTIAVTQNYLSLRQMPGNQPPAYTRVMRLNREQGVGQLVYFVNRDGTVSDVRLTKSTGFPDLDKAAVDAFSKYRFVPGQQGYTVHNFEFVLNGPAIADGPGLRTTMNN